MTKEPDQFNIFRQLDTCGLVIFDRWGTILRQRSEPAVLSLADIDMTVIDVLHRLRNRGVGFGFISDQHGIEGGQADQRSASVLIEILDGILRAHDASPNFWLAWPTIAKPAAYKSPDLTAMIARVLEHYDVDISRCAFVGASPKGLAAAARLGIDTLEYRCIAGTSEARSETAEMISRRLAGLTQSCTGHGPKLKTAPQRVGL